MKNKLFLIVAICAMFSSCNKSTSTTDPTPTPTPTPDPEQTIEFAIPIMAEDGHREIFELQYEFDLAGTKVTFKESDAILYTPTTKQDSSKVQQLLTNIKKALIFEFGFDHKKTAPIHKYTLGKLKKGETVSAVSRTPIIRSDRSAVDTFNIISGGELFINGKELEISEITYHKSVSSANDDIIKFFSLTNKSFKNFTYTYSK